MALKAGKRPWKAKKEKFHTCGGPRRRPGLGQGRGRRISIIIVIIITVIVCYYYYYYNYLLLSMDDLNRYCHDDPVFKDYLHFHLEVIIHSLLDCP